MAVDVDTEFDRQVATMLAAGYPRLAGMSKAAFLELVSPLRDRVPPGAPGAHHAADGSHADWLIVVPGAFIPAESIVPMLRLPAGGLSGVVDRNHGGEPLSEYVSLPALLVPEASPYLLLDVDRGDEFLGVRPRDAVPVIIDRGRTPLTIHEGLAFAMQHPAAMERKRCFMLAGSRRGDKRVPALWISQRAPKLGWCWEGNMHTWLGIASAGSRIAVARDGHESA